MEQSKGERDPGRMRPVQIELAWNQWAEGSCLIQVGATRVLVTASVEARVPPFLRGSGKGWVTAEYAMLPRATRERTVRESVRGRPGGRSMEIQRLIGRSLRAVVDLSALGERSIVLDCDVLQADGGTRTAAINAGFLALLLALANFDVTWERPPLVSWLGAVSVGWGEQGALLDLDYGEDSDIGVDMNVVAREGGQFVEIQGSAEKLAFDRDALNALLDVALAGIDRMIASGKAACGNYFGEAWHDVERRLVQHAVGAGES